MNRAIITSYDDLEMIVTGSALGEKLVFENSRNGEMSMVDISHDCVRSKTSQIMEK